MNYNHMLYTVRAGGRTDYNNPGGARFMSGYYCIYSDFDNGYFIGRKTNNANKDVVFATNSRTKIDVLHKDGDLNILEKITFRDGKWGFVKNKGVAFDTCVEALVGLYDLAAKLMPDCAAAILELKMLEERRARQFNSLLVHKDSIFREGWGGSLFQVMLSVGNAFEIKREIFNGNRRHIIQICLMDKSSDMGDILATLEEQEGGSLKVIDLEDDGQLNRVKIYLRTEFSEALAELIDIALRNSYVRNRMSGHDMLLAHQIRDNQAVLAKGKNPELLWGLHNDQDFYMLETKREYENVV